MKLTGREVSPGFLCSGVQGTRWKLANFWSIDIRFIPNTPMFTYDPDKGHYDRVQIYEKVDLDVEIGACKSVVYPAPVARRGCGSRLPPWWDFLRESQRARLRAHTQEKA